MGMSCGGFPPRDLDNIARRDLALLFKTNHVSADNAATEIRVRYAEHWRVRGRSDLGEDIDAIQKLPPLDIFEEGEIKNDGVAWKMPHFLQQLTHRKIVRYEILRRLP